MATTFLDILKDIRGINSTLDGNGNADNADDAPSQETGGIFQRIKDIREKIKNLHFDVVTKHTDIVAKYSDILITIRYFFSFRG